MKLYLSGPMTGYPEHNFPAFLKAERQLRSMGHEVISPREISIAHGSTDWLYCIREDLREMTYCEGVVIMDGWLKSRGARLEVVVFRLMGLPIFSLKVNELEGGGTAYKLSRREIPDCLCGPIPL